MDSSSSSTTEQTGPAYPTSPVWDFSDLKNELLCRVDPSRRSISPTPDVRGPEHLPHEPDTSPPPSQLSKAKGFAKLPAELCIKILGYLPIEAKLTGMRVCKEWSVNMMERSVWESFDLEGFTMTDSNRCLLSILERALKHAHGNLKHMVLPHAALPFVLERALFDYLAGCDVRYEDVTPIWGDIMPNLESLTFGGRSEDFQRLLYPHLARMTSLKALHILSPASESFPGSFNGIHWPSGHLSLSLRRLSIHVCPGIFTYQKWPWQDLIEELEYYGTGGSICIESIAIFSAALKVLKIADCTIHSKALVEFSPYYSYYCDPMPNMPAVSALNHFSNLRYLTFTNCGVHVGLDLPLNLRTFTIFNSWRSGRIAAKDQTFEKRWRRYVRETRVWARSEMPDGAGLGEWKRFE